jgi:hypothetical protein
MPDAIREKFKNTLDPTFNIKERYKEVFAEGGRSKQVLEESIEQHTQMCVENSETVIEARQLAKLLEEDIQYRVQQYTYCIMNNTKNYKEWLEEDYIRKLRANIARQFATLSS